MNVGLVLGQDRKLTKENKKSSWQDLPLRIASAVVIIPLAAFCIIDGEIPFVVLLCCLTIGLMIEWANLFKKNIKSFLGVLWVLWPLAAYAVLLKGAWYSAIVILGLAMVFGQPLWLGTAVIGLPGLALLWLRFMNASGMWAILFVVAVVIASDSFAYLFGKCFGGPKLIPSVSPGKTWSGAIGGLIAATCTGIIIAWIASGNNVNNLMISGVLGLFTGIFSQIGDLLESKLKRMLGVKDSGNIIPGHGGLLDRLDALLMASVFVAIVSIFIPQGMLIWQQDNKWMPTQPDGTEFLPQMPILIK